MQVQRTRKKVGLALGGGGARGLAHIGVIKALVRAEIPIDLIAGTSVGAIVGAVFSLDPNFNTLEEKLHGFLKNTELSQMESLFKKTDTEAAESRHSTLKKVSNFMRELFFWRVQTTKQWVIDNHYIEKILYPLVKNKTFKDCKIPFYVVTTDLLSGKRIVLEDGSLLDAILATSAIPGIMQPVPIEGYLLTDGNITDPIPVELTKEKGADIVIAVNVGHGIKKRKRFRNIADISEQADYIKTTELSKYKLKAADIVIEPKVKGISWAHFSKAAGCIQRGELATWKTLPQIKALLKKKKKVKFWKKMSFFSK